MPCIIMVRTTPLKSPSAALAAPISPLLRVGCTTPAGSYLFRVHDTHLVLTVPRSEEGAVCARIAGMPDLTIVGTGRCMEIYKEVGRPEIVAERFGLAAMPGTHGIGHTRMATESAVTTDGAHPFSTGADQCLVHNGSLSNHNGMRRELQRRG